jgi:diaminohydroxyphosphoribosylaminopyrimidine deaminase/5-amino-6-(5-phosphoribosylamino)uracil reductase
MVEGGPTVHGALLRDGLVDRLVAYVAGAVLGPEGRPGFLAPTPATLAAAPRLRLQDVHALGDDVRLDYTPVTPEEQA